MIERPHTSWKGGSLALLLFAVIGMLVLLPLMQYLGGSLLNGFSGLEATREMLRDPGLQQAFVHTLAIAVLACALASVIAVPAAFAVVRTNTTVRVLVQLLAFLPLTMPPFLSAAVFQHLARTLGLTLEGGTLAGVELSGSEAAMVLVFALHYLPLILFCVVAGLRRIDRSLTESAMNQGAGRLLIWRRITLPLLSPAYGFGAALVLLRIFEDIGTPLLLGVDTMLAPLLLSRLGESGTADPLLGSAALLLMGSTFVVATLAWSTLAHPPWDRDPGHCFRNMRWRAGASDWLIGLPLITGLGILALAPHAWLILMSLAGDWSGAILPPSLDLERLLQHAGDAVGRLDTTLVYVVAAGILTMALAGAFGTLTWRPGRLGRLARFSTTTLYAIPGVVLALAYLHLGETLGLSGTDLPGIGWLGLVFVIALKQLPLAEHAVASRLRALHSGALQSALSLGSSRLRVRLQIGLPALTAALTIAFLVGCIAATVELSAALLLIQGTQAPLAVDLFHSLRAPTEIVAGSVRGLLLTTLSAGLLLPLFWLLRQCCYRPKAPLSPSDVSRISP